MRTQLARYGLVAAALAAVVAVAPAGAADKPKPCGGNYLLTDKAGDTNFDPTSSGLPGVTAVDSADLTGLFFTLEGGKLMANIEIAKLDLADMPSPAEAQGGVWYYVHYSYKGESRFVRAANRSGGELEFAAGSVDSTGVYTTDPDTVTGAAYPGDKGVISIEIPARVGGKEGETLGAAGAAADYIQGADDQAGINNHVDTIPDDFSVITPDGRNYKVAPCASTGGPTGPSGPTGPVGTTTLPLSVKKTIGKASKAKKGKSLAFTVRSSAPITNLSAKLKKKSGTGATLAAGKLAAVNGAAKLSLKFKKTLKKGSYKLIATGTADGARKTVKKAVKLK
jgi:hypothetical protein